jgi:hypothetical protein
MSFKVDETPWLRDADVLIRTPEDLPEDALRAAEALGISASRAFGQVTSLWGKVDTEERAKFGAAGEIALVDLLKPNVAATVDHVAANWDGLGYDVALSAPAITAFLEVKSTRRRARLVFYLSRNEFETMLREPRWHLVMVHLDTAMNIETITTVPRDWIAAQAARDNGNFARWESCRFDVPMGVPETGLRFLQPVFKPGVPSLLAGGAQPSG